MNPDQLTRPYPFLARLKIDDVHTFTGQGKTFRLKRLHRNVYQLSRSDITERSRFGSKRQINHDIAFALSFGVLCGPSGPRW